MDDDDLLKSFMESSRSNATRMNRNLSDAHLQNILDQNVDVRLDGKDILLIALSVMAIVTNALTLTAIRHIRRRLTSNQTMMFSLCCADLLTAVAILAKVFDDHLFDIRRVPEKEQGAAYCVYKVTQGLIFTGHNATLSNLLCLAVDHFCAIAKPLTYSVYMSKSRVHIILASSWVISVLFGFSDFWIPAELHGHCQGLELINYCERAYCSKYEPDHLMFCMVLTCLTVMSIMYGCIMCILYRYQRQEYTTVTQRKVQRHIRGLVTSFIILALFAVFWLPNCILDSYTTLRLTLANDRKSIKLHLMLYPYLYALVILNAICDPIVYAMRMREIQESLKLLLCFRRPTFSNKMNAFGDNLKQSSNSSIPLKYVQRQSSNSTNMTICSGGTIPTSTSLGSTTRRQSQRQSTLNSQDSERYEEETPLNDDIPDAHFEYYS